MNDDKKLTKSLTMASEEPVTNMLVVKSNKLVEAQSTLEASGQKVLAACISLINPLANYDDMITVELTDQQLEHLTGIQKKNLYRFIDKTARDLVETSIATPGKAEGTIDYISIAHRCTYDPDDRTFKLTFHPEMTEELVDLTTYTSISLRELVSLRRKYAMRFFELIEKNYNKKGGSVQWAKIPLDKLIFALCVESDSLKKQFGRLRQKVLDPAVEEINLKTRYEITISPYRVGRKVAGVTVQMKRQRKGVAIAMIDGAPLNTLLKQYKIPETQADILVERHGPESVRNHLRKMCEIEEVKGVKITDHFRYLSWMLDNRYCELPDVANPESSHNRDNMVKKSFVRSVLLPIWWKLPEDLRQDIEHMGSIENHFTTGRWFMAYEKDFDFKGEGEAKTNIDYADILKDCIHAWDKLS